MSKQFKGNPMTFSSLPKSNAKGFGFIMLIFGLFWSQVFAASQNGIEQQTEQKIKDAMSQAIPELSIDEIALSPVSGMYQINMGPNILYISEDARYVFTGDIIDIKNNRENITEIARKSLRVSSLKKMVQKNAISFAPKNPQYRIVVFTDIDCGYCRKFHNHIVELNKLGVAVDYLAFPRGGPNSSGFDKMVNVWCSDNKQVALTDAKSGKPIPNKICKQHHVGEQFEFGMMMGINGTPTMILEDGSLVPGYLPPERILELLQKTS